MLKIGLSLFLLLTCSAYGVVRGAYHNHFAIELDYVLMRRANSHNKHLVSAAGASQLLPLSALPPNFQEETGKPLIESKNLVHDMGFNTGFSIALKVFPSIRSTWEARYLGGLAWRGQKTITCPYNLNLDGSLAQETVDYQFATHVKALYLSKMYTYELNYQHHITPRYTDHFSVSWLAGLRYFDIDEKIKMFFTKGIQGVPETSRYRVRTENTSFGLQLGG